MTVEKKTTPTEGSRQVAIESWREEIGGGVYFHKNKNRL